MSGNELSPVMAMGAMAVCWVTGYCFGLAFLQIKRMFQGW